MRRSDDTPIFLAVLIALLAVCSLSAGYLLDQHVFPWLAVRNPLKTASDVFRQTFALRVWTCYGFGLTAFVASLCLLSPRCRAISNGTWSIAIIVTACLLRVSTPDIALNSVPRPDGIHYSLLASSIAEEGSLLLPFGLHRLPSRYSLGPSLAMLPSQWLHPDRIGWGIFSISVYAWLSIAVVFLIGRRIFDKRTGLIAAMLLSLSPAHGYYSRQLMGEIPWSLAVLVATLMLLRFHSSVGGSLAAGVVLGLGLLFKPPHLGVVAAAAGAVAIGHIADWRRLESTFNRRASIAFFAGIVAGALPLLFYQHAMFGDWLRTGYHAYGSAGGELAESFSPRYLFGSPHAGGVMGNIPYYAMTVLGLDPRPERLPWVLPIALLLVASLVTRKHQPPAQSPERRRFNWFVGLASLGYGFVFLFYSYQDTRFFLPILPLWMILLAPAVRSFLDARKNQELISAACMLILAAAVALLLAIIYVERPGARVTERERLETLAAEASDFDAIVTDEDPFLLTYFGVWNDKTTILPLMEQGNNWIDDDPLVKLRQLGVVTKEFGDVVAEIDAKLHAGRRIGLWVRFPYRHRKLLARLDENFRITEVDFTGLREISLRE